MKILLYDCFSGISGDMNLGAMIDLGIDKSYLTGELKKLNLDGWELLVEKDQRHGIRGTKVTVVQKKAEQVHRHLSEIENIINTSGLSKKVKDISLSIFKKIAVAESTVHGIEPERVHFHEVGAIDSIIDIVGAAICYVALNVDEVRILDLELGGGFVNCAHGKLPVPAPATAEILRDMPVKKGNVDFEATTPTGAAIIATLARFHEADQPFTIIRTAYGVGHHDHPDIPNLLRVFISETATGTGGHDAVLMQCNIDDMNPELYEYISEKLFAAGASDVYVTNIIMKKGRPANMINVICEKGYEDNLKTIIFSESTTTGIRIFTFRKDTLLREFNKINTVYGEVTVKASFYKGKMVSCKPEFEECRKIAADKGIPAKKVYNEILSEYMNAMKGS